MTEVTREPEPFDLFTSIMIWIPLITEATKVFWARRRESIKFRRNWNGRHEMNYLGTERAIRASDIVVALRLERLSLRAERGAHA